MDNTRAVLRKPSFGLECFKLLISMAACGVIVDYILVGSTLSEITTVYVTLMGFPMLQIVVIMSELLKKPLHMAVVITINVAGFAMYTASAAVMFTFLFGNDWQFFPEADRLMASAILAVFDAVFCLASIVLAAMGS